MKAFTLLMGAFFGLSAVILGALGSHAFSKFLTESQLKSFDIGVKYQMYHALLLVILAFVLPFSHRYEKIMIGTFVVGVVFFSMSIYGLTFQHHWGISLKFLGPITPLGGLLMIIGWTLLLYHGIKMIGKG